jgi:hypothetical protein
METAKPPLKCPSDWSGPCHCWCRRCSLPLKSGCTPRRTDGGREAYAAALVGAGNEVGGISDLLFCATTLKVIAEDAELGKLPRTISPKEGK